MNEYIAALVDELHQLGVRHAVFSPGSRSTTLAMLFQSHGGFHTYMNIDERSAGFMALGIGKAHGMPAVLVCTSGSAMTHYGPAIVEAKHSGVPLIVLSADRPYTLQHVGAPQTIDQQKYFGTAVNYYEELSVPSESHYYTYPRQVARRAFIQALGNQQGPVHVNVPLFEPLVPDRGEHHFQEGRLSRPFRVIYGRHVQSLGSLLENKKILILGGPSITNPEAVVNLGHHLQAPIIGDPLSNLRNYEGVISTYDAVLANHDGWDAVKPDVVIQFGQIPVSKRIQQWMGSLHDIDYIEVHPTGDYMNPSLTSTIHITASIEGCIRELLLSVKANEDTSYMKQWQSLEKEAREQLDAVQFEENLFEGRTLYMLQECIPPEAQLLVGNSMTIRDMDYFWATNRSQAMVYGNRGTNGIDGGISTALGLSTTGKPTVMITGDLSFFHDLNGLAIGKTHSMNLTIILHNNDGGGIFQYLPQKGTADFDYLFNTPQGLDYSGLATLYGIDYVKVGNQEELSHAMKTYIGTPGIHLIEVPTSKEGSRELHKKYRVK